MTHKGGQQKRIIYMAEIQMLIMTWEVLIILDLCAGKIQIPTTLQQVDQAILKCKMFRLSNVW